MNIFKKVDGKISYQNVFNFLVFLTGGVEIFRPFIPSEYLPVILAVIAAGNLFLRTFYSSGLPIQGTSLKAG